MKRLVIMLSIAVAAAFVFAACDKDEKADLAWKNSDATANAINEIVWADEVEWSQTDGFAPGAETVYKEVTEMTGAVECAIDDGDDFVPANVLIEETGGTDNTLSLNDGDKEIYTLEATPAKK